jgi:hypothetical protein
MENETDSKAGIAKNKGKFAVLVLYALAVFGSPLFFFTPWGQASVEKLTGSVFTELDQSFFREFITELRNGEVEEAYTRLAPEVQEVVTTEDLKSVASTLAYTSGNPEVVGGKFNRTSSATLTDSDTPSSSSSHYEVIYSDENTGTTSPYAVISLVAEDNGGGMQILGIHVTSQDRSIEELTSFNWSTHGLYLVLSILLPAFIIFTAFQYLRKSKKPHWGMFLVILLLSLYFTHTGDTWKVSAGFNGAFTAGQSLTPWIFALPLPLGAIIYYVRPYLKKRQPPEQVSAPTA